jgi:hypothetical protein
MEQGIILATKMLYRKRFLEDVTVLLEYETDECEDTRGQRTKSEVLHNKISNFQLCSSFESSKGQTLENGWKKLLNNMDADVHFEGCEVSDFHRTIWNAGQRAVTEDAILHRLVEDEGDPGYQVITGRDIADEVMARDKTDEESDYYEEEGPSI